MLSNHLKRLSSIPDTFDQLELRERLLIMSAAAIITFMLWLLLVHDELARAQNDETRAIANTNSAIHAEIASQSELRDLQARAPNDQLRNRRDELKAELDKIASQLDNTVSDFVDPEQMPLLLEEVFARHKNIQLLSVINLAPVPLELEPHSDQTGIFKHTLRLELEGSYFDVVRFLTDIEKSRWGLRWKRMNYTVAEYPLAQVLLEVETLSRDQYVLGV